MCSTLCLHLNLKQRHNENALPVSPELLTGSFNNSGILFNFQGSFILPFFHSGGFLFPNGNKKPPHRADNKKSTKDSYLHLIFAFIFSNILYDTVYTNQK